MQIWRLGPASSRQGWCERGRWLFVAQRKTSRNPTTSSRSMRPESPISSFAAGSRPSHPSTLGQPAPPAKKAIRKLPVLHRARSTTNSIQAALNVILSVRRLNSVEAKKHISAPTREPAPANRDDRSASVKARSMNRRFAAPNQCEIQGLCNALKCNDEPRLSRHRRSAQ